ncbi:MAG: PAS domain-containing protein [Schleiferiaceae bacterium]|jgi:PAS domain-containing protein|nr:PAS domain-containing protein [Schleiferiaceae bacterium]
MSQHPLELILARQFADSMNMAVFLVDPEGNLLFYNEAAEDILGIRYSETGAMPVDEWATVFKPTDEHGEPLPPEGLPLVKTLSHRKPAHGSLYIANKLGHKFSITVTSYPIEGKPDRYLGAMALFWKTEVL